MRSHSDDQVASARSEYRMALEAAEQLGGAGAFHRDVVVRSGGNMHFGGRVTRDGYR
jgi:hypothetical protein